MRWTEPGFILSGRRHSESNVIIEGWTRSRGRVKGLVRGGSSRRLRGVIQTGSRVIFTWSGRLAEQLGVFTIEPYGLCTAELMNDRLALSGLHVINELVRLTPEHDSHPVLFDCYESVLKSMLQRSAWPAEIVRLELTALREIGFGLDLASCVVTGMKDDLIYVSPKSGRAVSRMAGAPYHDRLLPLPSFLLDDTIVTNDPEVLLQGFRLTSFFLHRNVYHSRNISSPYMRELLIRQLTVA